MPTARWFRATAGTDPVRALASVAWGVGVGLALTACDTTNKGMAAASGCDGAACPVGTSLEEARSVSSTERDVSDGAGPSADDAPVARAVARTLARAGAGADGRSPVVRIVA